jgi:signal transduction histidine kinase
MADTQRLGLDHDTLLAYQRQYHSQKRLAESLFGLFRTLGSALEVERVANVGLLTLTGQLLIKGAGFLQRHGQAYRVASTVGTRDPRLIGLQLRSEHPLVKRLFEERRLLDLTGTDAADPTLDKLRIHGFTSLFPLLDGGEPLGILALGQKIVPGPLAAEDLQILDAFGVVISVSLKHSLAFQLVDASRAELERLNEMKREFLSHVSHEFRTPLTVLKNIFEMMDVDPEIAAMQRSALARLENLIDSVLLLNEINSRGMKLEPQLLDGQAWIHNQVEPLLDLDGQFLLHADLGPGMLEFDSFKVGKALEGLLNNAVKFGGEAVPEVAIYRSTRTFVIQRMQDPECESSNLAIGFMRPPAPVAPDDSDAALVVEVKDRGIGIPRGERDAIFQPFTQAVNSPTRGVSGAGLGLAMAKRIVDAHGGELFCRSVVGEGTIFYMAVPCAPVGSV